MTEQVYRVVQIGVESTPGTAVAATVQLPIDPTTIELDRASQYANEDYGRNARNHASRGYHGLRAASMPFAADLRFEDIMRFLEMHYAGGITPSASTVAITTSSIANPTVITTSTAHGLTSGDTVTIAGHSGSTPTINGSRVVTVLTSTTFTIPVNVSADGTGGTVTTGYYAYLYPLEAGASTVKTYTVEEGVVGSTQDEWRMVGSLIDDMTLEYDALAAPGAQPWRVSGTMLGFGKDASTMTASKTAPATLETAMGHLTVVKEGSTATAFASLSALTASLIRFSVNTNRNRVRRAYGAASGDVATGWGVSERTTGTFELMLKIGSTSKSDVYDAWNSSGGALTEKRVRVECAGSGSKMFQYDLRAGYTQVGIDDRDGERVFLAQGELVDDTTLNAPAAATVTNRASALVESA